MVIQIGQYGISTKVARFDHYHYMLSTGHGLVHAVFDGSRNSIFSIDFGGFENDFGTEQRVARSDHKHSYYLEENVFNSVAIVDVTTSGTDLLFLNKRDEIVSQLTVDYSKRAEKLNIPRKIELSGNITRICIFWWNKWYRYWFKNIIISR